MRYVFVGLLLLAFNGTVLAQTSVPFAFTSGTAAKASEVNANFQALATAIDNLTARVGKLEGQLTAADVAGTYAFVYLDVETGGGGGLTAIVRHTTVNGSVTLNADGTFALSVTESSAQLNLIFSKDVNAATNALTANTNLTSAAPTGSTTLSDSGTWSFADKMLVLSGAQFSVTFINAAGPSLFISAKFIPTESNKHNNALVFLVRTN